MFAAQCVSVHEPRTKNWAPPIWFPLLVLTVVSWLVRVTDLDRALQQKFWSSATGWHLANAPWVQFLYHYGTWPALIIAGGGMLVWLLSFWLFPFKPMRQYGGFLALAMILGPGLLINGTFKEYYGRPRPRNVVEFGGTIPFRPLGEPTLDHRGRSFPSGHASAGFFWLAPCIYLWPRRRRVALAFGVLALAHGGLMGAARMAQGAHWFSDNLWAAGMIYLSSWAIYRALVSPYSEKPVRSNPVCAATAQAAPIQNGKPPPLPEPIAISVRPAVSAQSESFI